MEKSARNWTIVLAVVAFVLLGIALTTTLKMLGTQRQLAESQGRFKKTEQTLELKRDFLIFESKLTGIRKNAEDKEADLDRVIASEPELDTWLSALRKVKQAYEDAAGASEDVQLAATLPTGAKGLAEDAKGNMVKANKLSAESMGAIIEAWEIRGQGEDVNAPPSPEAEAKYKEYDEKRADARAAAAEARENLDDARAKLNLPGSAGIVPESPLGQEAPSTKSPEGRKLQSRFK